MKITSPAFQNDEVIPPKYTCDRENVNPELIFSDIPENTKSLALILHDPDAAKPGGWTHWAIVNMEPSTTGIAENSKPSSGIEVMTDFGKTEYEGPCPPNGQHRYIFYLYALDFELSLDSSTTKKEIEGLIQGHILDKSELIGTYQRV